VVCIKSYLDEKINDGECLYINSIKGLDGKSYFEDKHVDGRIILKFVICFLLGYSPASVV
jgi:hypothetical protein